VLRRVFPLYLGIQILLPSLCQSCTPAHDRRSPILMTPALNSQVEFGPTWSLWTCLAIVRLLAGTCHRPHPGPTVLMKYHGNCNVRAHRFGSEGRFNCCGLSQGSFRGHRAMAGRTNWERDMTGGTWCWNQVTHDDFRMPGELTGWWARSQHWAAEAL